MRQILLIAIIALLHFGINYANDTLEKKIKQLEQEVNEQKVKYNYLETFVMSLAKDRSPRLQPSSANRVGFSANMGTHGSEILPSRHATIKFPLANYNRGASYNTVTSHFRCPDHGTYIFSATIYSAHDKWVNFSIVLEGVIKSYSASGHAKGASSGTAIALLDCTPGTYVWVRLEAKSGSDVAALRMFSRFTGIRIW